MNFGHNAGVSCEDVRWCYIHGEVKTSGKPLVGITRGYQNLTSLGFAREKISKSKTRFAEGDVEISLACLKDVFLRTNLILKTTPQFLSVFIVNFKLVFKYCSSISLYSLE